MTEFVHLSRFRFAVEITPSGLGGDDGLGARSRGAFSEVTGLEATLDVEEVREGGFNAGVRRLVGKATHAGLVLKRGLSLDPAFWEWIARCTDGSYPLPYVNGSVLVFTSAAENDDSRAARFDFDNAVVTKVVAQALTAGEASDVAIEELHLVHEGLRRVSA